MRPHFALGTRLGVAVLLLTLSAAACAADAPSVFEGKAAIKFRGSSTLHDFSGTVESQPFKIQIQPADGDKPATWSAETDVIVKEMTTANKSRDKKMMEMFDAEKFPRIHGVIQDALLPQTADAKATMRLRIRDKELSIPVTLTQWKRTENLISFHASWEVSLKDYGLTAPSVMGIVRVADKVTLESDVTAKPVAPKN